VLRELQMAVEVVVNFHWEREGYYYFGKQNFELVFGPKAVFAVESLVGDSLGVGHNMEYNFVGYAFVVVVEHFEAYILVAVVAHSLYVEKNFVENKPGMVGNLAGGRSSVVVHGLVVLADNSLNVVNLAAQNKLLDSLVVVVPASFDDGEMFAWVGFALAVGRYNLVGLGDNFVAPVVENNLFLESFVVNRSIDVDIGFLCAVAENKLLHSLVVVPISVDVGDKFVGSLPAVAQNNLECNLIVFVKNNFEDNLVGVGLVENR